MARPKKVKTARAAKPRRAKAAHGSFPLAEEFLLEAVRVVDLCKTPVAKGTKLELVLRGRMTPGVAEQLACRGIVFTEANNARSGYKRLALDIAKITGVHLCSTMGYRGRTPLDVQPQMLNGFAVVNTAGHPELLFRAVFDGYAQQLSDFTDEVGAGLFALAVRPAQRQMFDQTTAEAPPPVPPAGDARVQ